jgi:hypothetical protein
MTEELRELLLLAGVRVEIELRIRQMELRTPEAAVGDRIIELAVRLNLVEHLAVQEL